MVHAHFLVKCYDTLEPNCMWACGGLFILESVKAGSCKLLWLPCDCGRNTFDARWNGCSKRDLPESEVWCDPSYTIFYDGISWFIYHSPEADSFTHWSVNASEASTVSICPWTHTAIYPGVLHLTTMTQRSLNSQSSRMWGLGARKVQVAVRRQPTW